MLTHVAVAQPWLVRECYHRIWPVLLNFGQLDASCAKELLSTVTHYTCDVVDKLAHENTIFQTYIKIELTLRKHLAWVRLPSPQVDEAYWLWCCLEGKHRNFVKKSFGLIWLKREDLNGVVHEASDHKFGAQSSLRHLTDIEALYFNVEELCLNLVK